MSVNHFHRRRNQWGGDTRPPPPPKFSICAMPTVYVLYYKLNLLHTVPPNQKVFPTPLTFSVISLQIQVVTVLCYLCMFSIAEKAAKQAIVGAI